MRILILPGVLVAALSLHAAPAATAAPSSTPSSTTRAAYTNHEYVRAEGEFNRRTLSQPYRQIGKRDAKWDPDVEKFLDAMAIRFANAQTSWLYHLPDEPETETLLKWAESARKLGCDDPMFLYCYAAVLHDSGRAAEARPLLASASKEVMTSRYPLNRAANAARRYAYVTDDPKERDAAWARFKECVLAMVTTWKFEAIDRRILFDQIVPLSDLPRQMYHEGIDEIRQHPNSDPWLANMLEGQYHITLGAEARGAGAARNVTPEAWKIHHEAHRKGRENYLAAWKLRPEYPESASEMVNVAMVGEFQDDLRLWFDRTIAAQFDDDETYEVYLRALLPRWGGSTAAMYEHGLACLDSGRFDTTVPSQFGQAVEKIAWDRGSNDVWKQPGVYDNVKRMCEGYLRASKSPRAIKGYQSYQAAAAWRAGRYAEARKLLDELRDDVDVQAFLRVRTLPKLGISHAYAISGDAAAKIDAAEQDAQAGKLDEAMDAYKSLAAAAKDKSAFFFKSRLRQLEWQKQFETGEWVNLQPDDADLTGWGVTAGTLTRDADGALLALRDPPAAGEITLQGQFFGSRYEIETTIELPDADSTWAGITTARNDPIGLHGRRGIYIAHGPGERCVMLDGWDHNHEYNTRRTSKTILRLQVWDDSVFVYVNDKKSLRKPDMNGWMSGTIYLGLSGQADPPDKAVKFTNTRIRRMNQPPESR